MESLKTKNVFLVYMILALPKKAVLKTDRCVKVYSPVKVNGYPKYGLIKKFKMDLMKVSRDKDPEINKY